MVDGWMGDDWFHNGAFRQQNMPYIYEQDGTRDNDGQVVDQLTSTTTTCSCRPARRASSDGAAGSSRSASGASSSSIPRYDAFWQDQAMDKVLAAQPLKVPVMLVHSLWDQEDIYGAIAVYKAIKPKDTNNDKVFLVLGPWHHGQEIEDGSALGADRFGSDTALTFRREVLRPFLDQYLKDDAPKADVAPVTAFETGTNVWRRLPRMARRMRERLRDAARRRSICRPGSKLSFAAPGGGRGVRRVRLRSGQARALPRAADAAGRLRHGRDAGRTGSSTTSAKRRAAPTSLAFTSDVLTAPVKISGQPSRTWSRPPAAPTPTGS